MTIPTDQHTPALAKPLKEARQAVARLTEEIDLLKKKLAETEVERNELYICAANIDVEVQEMESNDNVDVRVAGLVRSAASLMAAAVRMHPEVHNGITCDTIVVTDSGHRVLQVVAQWEDAELVKNVPKLVGELEAYIELASKFERGMYEARTEAEDMRDFAKECDEWNTYARQDLLPWERDGDLSFVPPAEVEDVAGVSRISWPGVPGRVIPAWHPIRISPAHHVYVEPHSIEAQQAIASISSVVSSWPYSAPELLPTHIETIISALEHCGWIPAR